MLTQTQENDIRNQAQAVADRLYDQIKETGPTTSILSERIDQQDFFQQSVVQALSAHAMRTRVDNEHLLRAQG